MVGAGRLNYYVMLDFVEHSIRSWEKYLVVRQWEPPLLLQHKLRISKYQTKAFLTSTVLD